MKYVREPAVQILINRLSLGQSVYLAQENVLEMKSDDITLEEYGVAKIPKTGANVKIVAENGKLYPLEIHVEGEGCLCIGVAMVNRQVFRGFLSEQDFWDWWEWRNLSGRLCRHIPSVVFDPPTQENLVQCRILYDLLVGRERRYQNLSCRGCIHSLSIRCTRCVRDKSLEDCWQDRSEKRRFQFE